VALLTNNPDKAEQLSRLGIEVTRRVPTGVHVGPANASYLATKVSRGSHLIDLPATGSEDRRSG
jgi:GTP cyclohydrolase II